MNKSNCCEKCWGLIVHFGLCRNVHCECHIQLATQTTPSEEWESEFERRFVIVESGRISGPAVGKGDYTFKNLKNDAYGMMDFIRETRTAAYEKGVRDSLEVVEGRLPDQMTEEERDKYHCEGSVLFWGEGLVKAISTLLK